MADYLVAKGVPPRQVLAEVRARTTRENLSYRCNANLIGLVCWMAVVVGLYILVGIR